MTVKWVRHTVINFTLSGVLTNPQVYMMSRCDFALNMCTKMPFGRSKFCPELQIVKTSNIICVKRGKKNDSIQGIADWHNFIYSFDTGQCRNFSCLFSEALLLRVKYKWLGFEACCGFIWMLNLVSSCSLSLSLYQAHFSFVSQACSS